MSTEKEKKKKSLGKEIILGFKIFKIPRKEEESLTSMTPEKTSESLVE